MIVGRPRRQPGEQAYIYHGPNKHGSPDWQADAVQAGAQLGFSVDSAGDGERGWLRGCDCGSAGRALPTYSMADQRWIQSLIGPSGSGGYGEAVASPKGM
jgi:hypothetical protein